MLLRTQIAQLNNSHCSLFLNNLAMGANALHFFSVSNQYVNRWLFPVIYFPGEAQALQWLCMSPDHAT